MTIDDVADYVITSVSEGGETLNLLKLQKLVYYVQAWHLAFHHTPLFAGKFQAWVHGPVSRELYDRFVATKSLYSPVLAADIRPDFGGKVLPADKCTFIDGVLEVYAGFTGSQLEELTHREDPWLKAREGLPANMRCERELDEQLMGTYYRARLPQQA